MTAASGSPYLLVSGDFVLTGGMDRANYALASYLARQGPRVELVAHRAGDDLLRQPTLTFHRVPKPLGSYWLSEPLLARAGRRHAARLSRQSGRVVVNGGNCPWPDVNWVHYVHAAWSPPPTGSFPRRLKGRLTRRTHLAAERAALRAARVVIANSKRTAHDLIDRLGVPPDRVHTLYYGSDPDRFRPATEPERAELRAHLGWPANRPVVAFVGALGDTRKGFDVLFDAWRHLAREPSWDAHLVVIGAGAALDGWKQASTDAGLDRSISFLGFRRDVPDLLRAADALVSPTRYEAYGLNVHEALCTGLPALVTRSAGVAERYPPALDDLLLPDPPDSDTLVSRLLLWRERADSLRPTVAPLAAELRSQTWDQMSARFLEILEESPIGH